MIITCAHCGNPEVQTWWLDSPTLTATLRYWPHRRPYGPSDCKMGNKPVQLTREVVSKITVDAYHTFLNNPMSECVCCRTPFIKPMKYADFCQQCYEKIESGICPMKGCGYEAYFAPTGVFTDYPVAVCLSGIIAQPFSQVHPLKEKVHFFMGGRF